MLEECNGNCIFIYIHRRTCLNPKITSATAAATATSATATAT